MLKIEEFYYLLSEHYGLETYVELSFEPTEF